MDFWKQQVRIEKRQQRERENIAYAEGTEHVKGLEKRINRLEKKQKAVAFNTRMRSTFNQKGMFSKMK